MNPIALLASAFSTRHYDKNFIIPNKHICTKIIDGPKFLVVACLYRCPEDDSPPHN